MTNKCAGTPAVGGSAVTPDTRALAAEIVDAVMALQRLDICDCGEPFGCHEFYDDKIYDVQGRKCPRGWSEFHLNKERSEAEQRTARIEIAKQRLDAALAAAPSTPPLGESNQ